MTVHRNTVYCSTHGKVEPAKIDREHVGWHPLADVPDGTIAVPATLACGTVVTVVTTR